MYKPKHRTRKEDTDFFQQLLEANRRAEALSAEERLAGRIVRSIAGHTLKLNCYEWRVILDSKGGCATVPKPERQRADRLPQLERAPLQPVASAVRPEGGRGSQSSNRQKLSQFELFDSKLQQLTADNAPLPTQQLNESSSSLVSSSDSQLDTASFWTQVRREKANAEAARSQAQREQEAATVHVKNKQIVDFAKRWSDACNRL